MRAEELCKSRGRPRLAGVVLAPVLVFVQPGDWAQGSLVLGDRETTRSHVLRSPTHPPGCPACQHAAFLHPHRTPAALHALECPVDNDILFSGASPSAAASPGGISPALHDRAAQAGQAQDPKRSAGRGKGFLGRATLDAQLATHKEWEASRRRVGWGTKSR